MAEIQMLQMFFCWNGKPGKYSGNHDQTYKEERHDIYARHDSKFSENNNISRQQCEKPYGYREVRKERCKSHLSNDNPNRVQLVFCFGKFKMILVEQVDGIGDTDGHNYRRDQSAEQCDLKSKESQGSQRPYHYNANNDHGKQNGFERAKEGKHDQACYQGRSV